MKILNVEYGDRPISEWLTFELIRYHEQKYGEACEILWDSSDLHGETPDEAAKRLSRLFGRTVIIT